MMLKGNDCLAWKTAVIAAVAILQGIVFAGDYDSTWKKTGNDIYNTNSGKIGAGTNNPGYGLTSGGQVKLHVAGSGFTAGQVDWRLWVSNPLTLQTPNGAGVGIKFQHGHDTTWDENKWAGVAGVAESGYSNQVGLALYSYAVERMRISAAGWIGVGTTSPGALVDIKGSASDDLRLLGSVNDSGTPILHFRDPNGADAHMRLVSVPNRNFEIYGGTGDNVGVHIKASGVSTQLYCATTGRVGIGTTSTDTFKLAVNGTIKAKGIVVANTGWSDFVFKKGYNLKPITEVEKFIKTNNHLEGIPTEKEVVKNGVSVGEMQAKLLQKVEELTLYVIELKKENAALQDRINRLEN